MFKLTCSDRPESDRLVPGTEFSLVGNDADFHLNCTRLACLDSSSLYQQATEAAASEVRMHGELLKCSDALIRVLDADAAADTIVAERQ